MTRSVNINLSSRTAPILWRARSPITTWVCFSLKRISWKRRLGSSMQPSGSIRTSKVAFSGAARSSISGGEGDAAIEDFRHAAQIAPSATVYFWLGSACERKGDAVCAAQAYEDALRRSPGLREAQNRLKMLQGKRNNPANYDALNRRQASASTLKNWESVSLLPKFSFGSLLKLQLRQIVVANLDVFKR